MPTRSATSHPCVLLVDDYEDALESWRLYLALSGYEVLTATNGLEALRLARECHPSLVVLDLDLPGMTGSEAARELRAAPETRATPLIAATGYSSGPKVDEARAAGFDAVLTKPCDPVALLNAIGTLIAESESDRQWES